MKHLWLGLITIFLVKLSFAGDVGGNGGGVGEQYVVFAYLNLERYLDLCLASESCRLSEKERTLLQNIRGSLTSERQKENQLVFDSEKKNPGFFKLDGQVRIAKTGDNVGSSIWVNVDLLYSRDTLGETKAIPFSTAVAILTHEFGHHHGIKDHLALDILGAKVATLLQGQTQETSVNPFDNRVVATAINFSRSSGNFTQLLIADGHRIVDLSSQFREKLACTAFSDAQIVYLMVWNLHWMRPRWDTSTGKLRERIPLRGQLVLHCARAGENTVQQDQDVVVDNVFERDSDHQLKLVADSQKYFQVDCGKKPNDCH